MKTCLSPETIEKLSDRSLRGQALVDALRHLEDCADCRAKVRMPTKEEILRRLEPEEDKPELPPSKPSGSSSDKEQDEAFKKLLDRIRKSSGGSDKKEFRVIEILNRFLLLPVYSFPD